MQMTLLDLTQSVLSALDSDEVNSITDTVESQQVAKLIKNCYYDIIARAGLPEHMTVFQLDASGDNTIPTVMYIPEDIVNVRWIKYDKRTADDTVSKFSEVFPMDLETFIRRMHQMNADDTNVDTFTLTVDSNDMEMLAANFIGPSYYTTFDDNTVLFDSYDAAVDTTLQKSKTWAYGVKTLTWEEADDFVPSLDDNQFPLLLNEAKALAFSELKQITHPKAEQYARRAWVNLGKSKVRLNTISDFDALPSFGRK